MFDPFGFLDNFNWMPPGILAVVLAICFIALFVMQFFARRKLKKTPEEIAAQKEKAEKRARRKDDERALQQKGFRWARGIKFFLISAFVVVLAWPLVKGVWQSMNPIPVPEITVAELRAATDSGEIREAVISFEYKGQRRIVGSDNRGRFQIIVSDSVADEFRKKFDEKKIKYLFEEPSEPSFLRSLFFTWGPTLLFILVIFYWMGRRMPGGIGGSPIGKGSINIAENIKDRFADVAGADEAKEEVQETIEFLKNPERFGRLGGKVPRGVLLTGPPGCGKTLLARAIAGEASVPFLSMSGSGFVEIFVGVGASRVRDLFAQGKKHAPCILFVDEIDAVGRHRGAGLGGGSDEREQTLNQLLVEMDGFEQNSGIVVIAATNRPDILDEALLRPGRFDRRVFIDKPDVRGREAILRVHTKNLPLDASVDLSEIARGIAGFTGADIASLCNEAALHAARCDKNLVGASDFEEAREKVLTGAKRKSAVISEQEKKITAYHEAGHTIVAQYCMSTDPDNTDPLYKVSIIPRGMALGVTQQLPLDDKHTYTKRFLLNRLAIMMGGRVAEEIILGDNITTGAANDIERATDLAKRFVCEFGMSKLADTFGPRTFGHGEAPVFLGKEVGRPRSYSDETAREIDLAIGKIVRQAYDDARSVVREHRAVVVTVAETLIVRETLDRKEIEALWQEHQGSSGSGASI